MTTTSPRPWHVWRSIRSHMLAAGVSAALLVGAVVTLGATTELSGAVIASGSLMVESSHKKVQHPTGGIVGELLVKDGAEVRAGDLLLRLDKTVVQSNLDTVTKALIELAARRARLEAEQEGAGQIVFPRELVSYAADSETARVLSGETRLFELRRAAQAGQKSQLRERVAQLHEEIRGLTDQASAKQKEIALVIRELEGVRDLFQKNLIQISRLIALERDAARLEGERAQLVAAVAQSRGKITETELQIIQVDQSVRSDVAKELGDIRGKTSELVERKVTAEDQLKRVDIRAPQDGIVHELAVHTVGGVIRSGEPIMQIVPQADMLIVEARVSPSNIDQLVAGQKAVLRFSGLNQRSTPELNGEVSGVSADTIQDQRTGGTYFLVRITLPAPEVARLGAIKLVPGMPVEAFIQTGERTMLSYLVKPIVDQAHRAFREK
jgi:HlyD family secretion protein